MRVDTTQTEEYNVENPGAGGLMLEPKYNLGDMLRYNTNYGELILEIVRMELEPSKYYYIGKVLYRKVKDLPYRWRIDLNTEIMVPIEIADGVATYLGSNKIVAGILYGNGF